LIWQWNSWAARWAARAVEIIFEDDGFKPEIGKQKTDKLVQQDDVPIVAGYLWSNVLAGLDEERCSTPTRS
jgi:ABC-type branched-subunit amino acid transport system substrate-binding protein